MLGVDGGSIQTTLKQLLLQVALLRKVREQRKHAAAAKPTAEQEKEQSDLDRARAFLKTRRATFA